MRRGHRRIPTGYRSLSNEHEVVSVTDSMSPALSTSHVSSTVPDLAIVIVNYHTRKLVIDCLDSIYRSGYAPLRIDYIVIDNASSDGCVGAIRANFPQVMLTALDLLLLSL